MTTFRIPVTWEVYDIVEIKADTIDEAIQKFDDTRDDIPLPTEPMYVEGSFEREDVTYIKDFIKMDIRNKD